MLTWRVETIEQDEARVAFSSQVQMQQHQMSVLQRI
jgi:hypothetical protein